MTETPVDERWAAQLEGSIAKLERAARSSTGERADVAVSRLRFLEEGDIDAEHAPAQRPERRSSERRVGERRIEAPPTADPHPEHVEIARSATEAARAATNAARLAAKAARAAITEARIHTDLARAANKTATTALVIATASSGATVALAVALLAVVLLAK
jgi:hypothetical protein